MTSKEYLENRRQKEVKNLMLMGLSEEEAISKVYHKAVLNGKHPFVEFVSESEADKLLNGPYTGSYSFDFSLKHDDENDR